MTTRTRPKTRGHYKTRKNSLKALFESIADGDIKTIALQDTNVSSLRTRAGELNREAGFQKYIISVDSFLGVVRIANAQ